MALLAGMGFISLTAWNVQLEGSLKIVWEAKMNLKNTELGTFGIFEFFQK